MKPVILPIWKARLNIGRLFSNHPNIENDDRESFRLWINWTIRDVNHKTNLVRYALFPITYQVPLIQCPAVVADVRYRPLA